MAITQNAKREIDNIANGKLYKNKVKSPDIVSKNNHPMEKHRVQKLIFRTEYNVRKRH
jgi:hypothetical protein